VINRVTYIYYNYEPVTAEIMAVTGIFVFKEKIEYEKEND